MDARLQLAGMTAGVGLVWGALGTDPSPPAQDDNLAPLTNVGHVTEGRKMVMMDEEQRREHPRDRVIQSRLSPIFLLLSWL